MRQPEPAGETGPADEDMGLAPGTEVGRQGVGSPAGTEVGRQWYPLQECLQVPGGRWSTLFLRLLTWVQGSPRSSEGAVFAPLCGGGKPALGNQMTGLRLHKAGKSQGLQVSTPGDLQTSHRSGCLGFVLMHTHTGNPEKHTQAGVIGRFVKGDG